MDLSEGFDIQANAETGAWMQVLHPVTNEELGAEEKKPCRIKLRGSDSMAYEEAVARTVSMRQAELKGMRANKKITAESILESADKTAKFQAMELARITLAWENLEWNGKPLKFTEENAVMVYREHKWLRDQAVAFFEDRTNYQGNA